MTESAVTIVAVAILLTIFSFVIKSEFKKEEIKLTNQIQEIQKQSKIEDISQMIKFNLRNQYN